MSFNISKTNTKRSLLSFFDLKRPSKTSLTISEQRKQWFKEFMKSFLVVFVVYACMYMVRNNFKGAQPLLVEQLGFTNTQLGFIGLAFSITYGIGKSLLGFLADGRNCKKIISFLLIACGIITIVIGILLLTKSPGSGMIFVFWGLNGLFQSPGGPASYSTVSRWTPSDKRGSWIGLWNASHNLGGGIAAIFALWGANTFFNGNVAGMFIVPGIMVIIVGLCCLFIGADDPEELGWNSAPEIFGEEKTEAEKAVEHSSKMEIFIQYVLRNPWVWILAVANVFTYIVRIGVDNWVSLYSVQVLGMSTEVAVRTVFFFEIGAFLGSISWGWITDLCKGRRMMIASITGVIEFFLIGIYQNAHTELALYIALFLLGFVIFGAQVLIGISVVGFVPSKAIAVTNGITGTFGYLFGDSLAKVGLGIVSDKTGNGLNLLGIHLQGWSATFSIFRVALLIGLVLMIVVAIEEERRIKKTKRLV